MQRVVVQFSKYPESPHWGLETSWLGEDEWGVWLWSPMGSRRWKGNEPWPPLGEDRVLCIPYSDWWVLSHNGLGPKLSHFIDIATPAVWSDGRVDMIDLDLDVVVHSDGTVAMEDEDEFAAHQVELGYPQDLIDGARDVADRVYAEVSRGEEPYFGVAAQWLERANDRR